MKFSTFTLHSAVLVALWGSALGMGEDCDDPLVNGECPTCPVGKCPNNLSGCLTECDDCFQCTATTAPVNNVRTVTICTQNHCEGAISWMCCGNADGSGSWTFPGKDNMGADVMRGCRTDNPDDGNKKNGVSCIDVQVGADATSMDMVSHDGHIFSTTTVNDEGRNSCSMENDSQGGGGNCIGGNTGHCVTTVDISSSTCGSSPPTSSGGTGDPHFQTWKGEWYDYMGACDLVLVKSPQFGKGLGLDVHVRTKDKLDYSYIEAAAVRIGDDILELGSYGFYSLNGVEDAEMPNTLAGYSVVHTMVSKKEYRLDIDLGDGAFIHMKAYKDLISVKFDGTNADGFQYSEGLMGQWKTGSRLGRDGKNVIRDDNEFGQEWQVQPDIDGAFFTNPAPVGEKCKLATKKSASAGRRLGASIAEEAAELACADFSGPAFSACVYDVMATGDLEAAQAGAF